MEVEGKRGETCGDVECDVRGRWNTSWGWMRGRGEEGGRKKGAWEVRGDSKRWKYEMEMKQR